MPANFGKRVDRPGGRRTIQREPVTLCVSAVSLEGARSAVLSNVSYKGAKLCGRDLPPEETKLLVQAGREAFLGYVAWSDWEQCGITFDPPLTVAQVEYLKKEGNIATLTGA